MVEPETVRTCRACGEEKLVDEFHKHSQSRGGRLLRCKVCTARTYGLTALRRQHRIRDRIAAIKLEAGCKDCGYRESAEALQFDHMPGHVKSFGISAMAGYSWPRILAEIAKCEVVCANCHAVRTQSRRPPRLTEREAA